MAKLRTLDLFAGIGGFSLGLERTGGFETVAFCEIEPFPQKVLRKHWPEVPLYDDVRTLTAERLAADGIAVDVITGGFPCQDISTAGKGAGLAGERSGLFYEIARLIGELGPLFVILENVSALLGRGLADVLGTLATLGYDAEWHCIPASHVGAPHRRDRIWIIAYPSSAGRTAGSGARNVNGKSIAAPSKFIRPEPSRICADVSEKALDNAQCFGLISGRNDNGKYDWNEFSATGEHATLLADTTSQRQQGQGQLIQRGCQAPNGEGQANKPLAIRLGGIWPAEPELGGSLDGFSLWLDGLDLGEPHKLLMAYANAESARPCETLRTLRDGVFPQDDERQTGGPFGISPQTVLFAFLCQLEKRAADEAWLQLEGAEASGEELRSLRTRQEPSRPSHRSESSKQRSSEHSNALQALSRLLAYHAEKAWLAYRRSDAAPALGWETGVARVANGVPDRAHRLKGLGNAVVPQIPELIGRAILDSIEAERIAA